MDFKKFLEEFDFNTGRTSTVFHVSPNPNIFKLRATGSNKGHQVEDMHEPGLYVAPTYKDALSWAASYVAFKKGRKSKHRTLHNKMHYQKLTIYSIEIPTALKDKLWFNNMWEKEYFIPEKYLPLLKITGRTTLNTNEISRTEKKNYMRKKGFYNPWQEKMDDGSPEALEYKNLMDKLSELSLKDKSNIIDKENLNKIIDKIKRQETWNDYAKEGLRQLQALIDNVNPDKLSGWRKKHDRWENKIREKLRKDYQNKTF